MPIFYYDSLNGVVNVSDHHGELIDIFKPGDHIDVTCGNDTDKFHLQVSGVITCVNSTVLQITESDDTTCRIEYDNIISIEKIHSGAVNVTKSSTDNVNHPSHYKSKSGLEAIDVIKAFTEDLKGLEATHTGNILKYVLRWHHKNGIEDLKKAQWYLNDLINELEKETD